MDEDLRIASGGRIERLRSSISGGEDLAGSGQYGCVFPAKLRGDEVIAVKSHRDERMREREQWILSFLKGLPCIVSEVSAACGNYLTMEICYNGNLGSLCEVGGNIPLPTRLSIARDICTGLQAMHNVGIAHEDLKPENVLLDYGLRAKLCDFGSSCIASSPEYLRVSGTEGYWSPEKKKFLKEIEAGGAATQTCAYDRMKADIYSLGLILEALQLIPDLAHLQQLGFTDPDPANRPDWDAITSALGKRSFNYKEDQLEGITEAELVNMAYCWTRLADDCENLTEARNLFCNSKFSEASQALQECLDGCTCDEDHKIITRLLRGTLLTYGLGTEKNGKTAREMFQEAKKNLDEAECLYKPHYVGEFTDFLMLVSEEDPQKARDELFLMAQGGHPLAQNSLLNNLFEIARTSAMPRNFRSRVKGWDSFGAYEHNEENSSQKQLRNSCLRLACKAASSGFALSQTSLTLLYFNNNRAKFRQLRLEPDFVDNTVRLPEVERRFLKEASEAGSFKAHLLLGLVDNSLDKEALEESGRVDAFKFLASIYSLLGDDGRAMQWLDIGAHKYGDEDCLRQADELQYKCHIRKEALNQKTDRLSAFDCALILQRQGKEAHALSYADVHLTLLLTKDKAESKDEENFSNIILKVLKLLLQLEENSKTDVEDTWYKLILAIESELDGIALASVGEHYRKKEEHAKAIYWFTEAFKKGYASAASMLESVHADKDNVVTDWLKLGEENGCPINPHDLMIDNPDKEKRISYLRRSWKKLKDPLLLYEFGVRLLKEGRREEALVEDAFQCLQKALDFGYEDATLHMAHRSKDNVEDLEYWMRRYIRNIPAGYAEMLGAQLYTNPDPLRYLLAIDNKQSPLHPDVYWRFIIYYVLAKQEEKAFMWLIKGAANREPKSSLMYGRLLRRRGYEKHALPFLLHALSHRIDSHGCLCEIVQCLNALGLPGNSRIILLIIMNLVSDPIQIFYGVDGDNTEACSSSYDWTVLFNELIRAIPDFGGKEEGLLGIWLHSSSLEEHQKASRLFLSTHEKEQRSLSSLYILSMLYTRIHFEESLCWLTYALQADAQFSNLLVAFEASFPPPGTGFQFLYEIIGLRETSHLEFLPEGDCIEIKNQLAQAFSIPSALCKISGSVSKQPSLLSPHSWEANLQLPISRSRTRGLLLSVHWDAPTQSTIWLGIWLNQKGYVSVQARSESPQAAGVIVMLPRRKFQSFLLQHDETGEDLVRVYLTVSNFEGSFQVERMCLDVVDTDMESCLGGYIEDFTNLCHESMVSPAASHVDTLDSSFQALLIR